MVWGKKKKEKEYEQDDPAEDSDDDNEGEQEEEQQQKIVAPSRPQVKVVEQKPVIVEREVTLSLINEKLNFLISKIQEES